MSPKNFKTYFIFCFVAFSNLKTLCEVKIQNLFLEICLRILFEAFLFFFFFYRNRQLNPKRRKKKFIRVCDARSDLIRKK